VTFTASTVARVTVIVLVAVVVQLAVVSQIALWGANADLSPLVVLAVGLLGGPIAGSVAGFFVGLLIDMSLIQTLGLTSLLLTVLGYISGRYRELHDPGHGLVPLVAGGLATLVYAAGFSFMQFLLGVESSVSGLVVRDILVGAALNALIATPVFAVVRAALRPVLLDYARQRARRSAPTGIRLPA
jgi:rod shape-determining protein MreD